MRYGNKSNKGNDDLIFRLKVLIWLCIFTPPFIVLFVMMCGYGFFTPPKHYKKYKDLNKV